MPLFSSLLLAAAAYAQLPGQATPVDAIKVMDGYEVELLYSVPQEKRGSWVNMCVGPQGRLIVSDQYGSLYRVTPPQKGSPGTLKIEELDLEIGGAHGLLWAFDSLYVVVNPWKNELPGGVYRVLDTDGDDQLDEVRHLRQLEGRGEHGPHAILRAPDGKSLYVVCGDSTPLTDFEHSRVPRAWDEDLLLPRPYGRGFMKGFRAPGGYVARIDPEGEHWEIVAVGFRNQFDAALNTDGELFTFDADMEWDMNTPWYRPTRICHVVSGAEFGWRNGGGKWPVYYPDSLPPVVDIGPGSPTGICFGYGAKFPAKYQRALFASDWSYGKLYAVHLQPHGATYQATFEEFLSGTPLPLTDVVIHPGDGAMYFLIGGRRVQSGLYRVTYAGGDSAAAADTSDGRHANARRRRHQLEAMHVGDHPEAANAAWSALAEPDRFVRYAARVALEHRPLSEWRERALAEPNPQARLEALLALVRGYERQDKGEAPDIDPAPPTWGSEPSNSRTDRSAVRQQIVRSLGELDWSELSNQQRVALLRVYSLAFLRLGQPTSETRLALIDRLAPCFPAATRELNSELAQMLVYLQAPSAAATTVELLSRASTQEAQIDYAKSLRHLRKGWTPQLRRTYFEWFVKARNYRGGASFLLFVENIRKDAEAHLRSADRQSLEVILAAAQAETKVEVKPRPFVKEWNLTELLPLVENHLSHRDFQHGREMFAAASCFACHRFDNQGGAVGPDLTALSGRFSPRDLLESIVDPNKTISDQYQAVTVVTDDGRTVTGRIVNLNGDTFSINTDMLDPNSQSQIDRKQIEEMFPSKVSMMPAGLLNTLNQEEVLDLMAYLLSRGDGDHPMFERGGEEVRK